MPSTTFLSYSAYSYHNGNYQHGFMIINNSGWEELTCCEWWSRVHSIWCDIPRNSIENKYLTMIRQNMFNMNISVWCPADNWCSSERVDGWKCDGRHVSSGRHIIHKNKSHILIYLSYLFTTHFVSQRSRAPGEFGVPAVMKVLYGRKRPLRADQPIITHWSSDKPVTGLARGKAP